DPEFDPVWEMCAKLKIPVLIHIAEPAVFFDPIDRHNERWLELKQFPGRARPPEKYPTFETLMTERNNLSRATPKPPSSSRTSRGTAMIWSGWADSSTLTRMFTRTTRRCWPNSAVSLTRRMTF